MKKQLRLLMLTLLCAVFSTAWGADETITFSQQNYTNGQEITEVSGVNFKITFDKGTNSNAPKYYTSGTAIRAYGGNTFTVSSSNDIKKIEITFGSSDGTNTITASDGTYSDGIWTVGTNSVNSVTFTIGGSSGNRRLSAVAVTFANVSGPKDPHLSFTDDPKYLTLGDDPYTNVITSTASGDPLIDLHITYEAKNFDGTGSTDVIEVDSESGAVTTKNSGSAKVIASWPEVEGKWIAKSISYTVYVNKKTAVIQPIENTSLLIGGTMNFTVQTNSDGVITVESNNTDVATVSGSGTSYTINAFAKGNAKITVSQAASETFKAAEPIEFQVNVTAPRPANTLFYEAFDNVNGSGGRDGSYTGSVGNNSLYTSGHEADEREWVITDNTGKEYDNGGASHCLKLGASNADRIATTRSIALTGDGTLTFSAAGWKGETSQFTISATGGTLTGISATGGTLSGNNNTTITLVSETWNDYTFNITDARGNLVITFTGHRGFFDDIVVTSTPINVTIGNTGYATLYYGQKSLVVPEGVTAYAVKVNGSNLDYTDVGDVIPAGTGVVLKGSKGEKLFYETTTNNTVTNNDLLGYDENHVTEKPAGAAATDNYLFYMLSGGNNGVGFYYATKDAAGNELSLENQNGGPFECLAHKAYLAVLNNGQAPSSFTFEDQTDINTVKTEVRGPEGVYTVTGVRMNSKNLPAGLYIVNGKKVIIK